MATFTVSVREVIAFSGTSDEDNYKGLALDSYPIYDEAYRKPLNQKIVNHFWNREIGQETVDMFQWAMRRKLNEIMPYYNQLYKSTLLEIDPFLTFKSTSSSTNESESSSNSHSVSDATNSSESNSKARGVHSDFPQNQLSETGDYASAADDSVSQTTANGSGNTEDTADSTGSSSGTGSTSGEGFSGSMSSLLVEYRQTFLNIDLEIIEELETLFMGLWSNGDEFTPGTISGMGAFGYGYGYGF